MILRQRVGHGWNDRRVNGGEGIPRVGDLLNNGGQYYHTVEKVEWQMTGLGLFFRQRLEPVVYLREHDRADEWEDAYDKAHG